MARYLLTGGSGFIGTHLVDRLIKTDAKILNLDLRKPLLPDHYRFWLSCDILNGGEVQAAIADFKPDVIVNMAAETDIHASVERFSVNTVGLQNLVYSMAASPDCHLIHFSTQLVMAPGHVPADDRDLKPYGAYGESKAISENFLWREAGFIKWTIVRPTTIWGPYHPSLHKATWKYLAKRYYLMPNNRAAVRSYGYVGNLVEQVLNIKKVDISKTNRQIYYVGDEPMSSEHWLDGFSIAFTGKKARRFPFAILKVLSLVGDVVKRMGLSAPLDSGRLERMAMDFPVPMQKTFDVLGKGSTSFEEGVRVSADWYRSEFMK